MRYLGWVLLIGAGAAIIQSLWIPIKAEAAQFLLERAWNETLAKGSPQRPWPWADHHPVARLIVPQHGVDLIVMAGDSGEALAFGPGENLEARNVEGGSRIISGHNDTHFRFMENVRPGDEFILQGSQNTVRYEVVRIDIVDADKTAINPAGNPDGLMLVTCYPFGTIDAGNNDYRLVVDAVTSSPSNI